MKQKFLIALMAVPLVFFSCNQDEIDALEKRLKRVENSIGNEPITFKFSTTDYDDNDVDKNAAYYFQSTPGSTHYMSENGDGTYYVYVERFSDVDWNDYVRVSFDYDPETKEVSNVYSELDYQESNFNNIEARFYEWDEATITVTVKSFNASTGKISFTAHSETTANSSYNYFEGQPMTLDLSFRGNLGLFVGGNE